MSSCLFPRQTPLYPPYQVAGRDARDALVNQTFKREPSCWPYDRDVDARTPLARETFESPPTPTPPRPPTIAIENDRLATTKLKRTATKPSVFNTQAKGLKKEPSQLMNKKRQRYLREVDRRSIIQRIENGEKQADLAREFGVTRAAICHIKRNREAIVSRYESLLASAQELERSTRKPASKNSLTVCELTQPSVQLLLTTLRDAATPNQTFRTSADRLMTLLIDEALASATAVSYTLCTTTGQTMRGVKAAVRPMCCVGVGEKGLSLVQCYRQIKPHGFIGGIDLVSTTNGLIVDRLDVPHGLMSHASFLLLSVSSATGQSLCASVQALQLAGVALEDIHVVVLVCTSEAVGRLRFQFPGVRIVACAIERFPGRATTLSDFLDRYHSLDRYNRG